MIRKRNVDTNLSQLCLDKSDELCNYDSLKELDLVPGLGVVRLTTSIGCWNTGEVLVGCSSLRDMIILDDDNMQDDSGYVETSIRCHEIAGTLRAVAHIGIKI